MDGFLITLLVVSCALGVLNLLFLIAIAGSVANLIKYFKGASEEMPSVQHERRLLDLPDRQPTYAEGLLAENPLNYDGVTPQPTNSDGVDGVIDR